MLGDTGLPVITSRITLTGFHTTIAGNNSTFRVLMVTGSGKLTLNGLTITGGKTSGPGGGILNHGVMTVKASKVTGSPVKSKFTVIARNRPDNCAPPGVVPGCRG